MWVYFFTKLTHEFTNFFTKLTHELTNFFTKLAHEAKQRIEADLLSYVKAAYRNRPTYGQKRDQLTNRKETYWQTKENNWKNRTNKSDLFTEKIYSHPRGKRAARDYTACFYPYAPACPLIPPPSPRRQHRISQTVSSTASEQSTLASELTFKNVFESQYPKSKCSP